VRASFDLQAMPRCIIAFSVGSRGGLTRSLVSDSAAFAPISHFGTCSNKDPLDDPLRTLRALKKGVPPSDKVDNCLELGEAKRNSYNDITARDSGALVE